MITNCVKISWVFIHSKHELTTALNKDSEQLDFFFINTRDVILALISDHDNTLLFSITVCVHNCTNYDDGDYQSCNTCNGYVSCGGHVLSNRDCPSTLVWDSLKGRCEYNSSTCDPQHLPKLNWIFKNCFVLSAIYHQCGFFTSWRS